MKRKEQKQTLEATKKEGEGRESAAEILGKMSELKLQKFGGADAKPTARHQ